MHRVKDRLDRCLDDFGSKGLLEIAHGTSCFGTRIGRLNDSARMAEPEFSISTYWQTQQGLLIFIFHV